MDAVEKYSKTFSPIPKLASLVGEIVRYLRESHEYYTNSALVALSDGIEGIIKPCGGPQILIIRKFFQQYKTELIHHFEYEESEVIPYIEELLAGRRDTDFSIRLFEEHHSSIDEKLSDLRTILKDSLPVECNGPEKDELFAFIGRLQDDIDRHTYIEDEVMVPLVRLLENMSPKLLKPLLRLDQQPSREELSDREKEILVSVASGLMNKEIADKHNISVNTVITHRKNITRKTGIKTTAGLTVFAILNNMIDIDSVL
ncbi:MAG: helix-turn-helix transcriptional regulator [Bacteroidales bacterium]|nr:helix-turn-helix transcriptional regulator [Bacteroidales bacterium]